jgi:hypothetical protein
MDLPHVITKLGSTFGADTAQLRVVSADEMGFEVTVSEERSRDREIRHTREMVSFIAISGASGRVSADSWYDLPRETLGEYGQISMSGAWQTIMLQGQYESPVVVFSEPGSQGLTPVVVRLRNVSSDSFQARLEGMDAEQEGLAPELLSFIVMESGDWITRSGARIIAGTRSSDRLSRQGWESVSHEDLGHTPVVLTQIQTSNESGWTVTRVRRQRRQSFEFTMQEGERENRGTHAEESVGYIVIDAGDHGQGAHRLLSLTSPRRFNHTMKRIEFEQGFVGTPSVIAKLGSTFGGDSANLRLSEINTQGFLVKVAEEQSRDRELYHTTEKVSYIALPSSNGLID